MNEEKLKQVIKEMKEALELYVDKLSYSEDCTTREYHIMNDGGFKAEQCLEKHKDVLREIES